MLAQIQEATTLMKEVAELGPIIKLLVALVLVLCSSVAFLFKKLFEQIEKNHEREKANMEVLASMNKVLEQNIRDRTVGTGLIRDDINKLHSLLSMYRHNVPHI